MDSSQVIYAIITVAYLGFILITTLISAFTIYIFLRYGKSRTTTLTISIIYSILFLILVSTSYSSLQNLKV
jgi:hypothetical protein